MPKPLLLRCAPDSIREFRAAARQRHRDAHSSAESGRLTAAIYLAGYAAEMVLKVAYFRLVRTPESHSLTMKDFAQARAEGKMLGLIWGKNYHHLMSWTELILRKRATNPAWSYPVPGFGKQMEAQVKRLEYLWDETLRYHKNAASPREVRQVLDPIDWLMSHSSEL